MTFETFRQFLIFLSSLPVNPVSLLLYGWIVVYGFRRIHQLRLFDGRLRFLKIFSSAIALLMLIVYTGEIIWWVLYTVKFNASPLEFSKYMLRNILVIVLSILCIYSMNIWPGYVSFDRKTVLGFCMLGLYIAFFFRLIPIYVDINWRVVLQPNVSNSIAVTSFVFPCLGKSIIAYIYCTMWKK